MAQVEVILMRRYGKIRLENLEELVTDWVEFKVNDFQDENDYLLAMEDNQSRKINIKLQIENSL